MTRKMDWRSNEFIRMVALGESTTAGGWSSAPDRCWAAILASLISDYQASPVEMFNAGIGANVISTASAAYPYSGKPTGLERLQKHVIDQHPDLLIVSYGENDARGGTPLGLFEKELVRLVRDVRKQIDPLIVLLGPYYVTDFTQGGEHWSHASLELLYCFDEAIARIAHEQHCLFVDVLSASAQADWMVHYDGVHQNDLGHRIIANRIFEVLAQNCSCLAQRAQELEHTSPRWRDESILMAEDMREVPAD